ncbi:hypothetical protein Tco_0467669 [Tanacetum coccineum]
MLYNAAILEEDTRKEIKASKRDLRSHHQTGGSSEGAGSKPEVLDESKSKTKDTSEGVGSKPEVTDVSKAMSLDQESDNEYWGESEDDDNIDRKNDETQYVDDEEYKRINEELYGDVNVEMKDAKPADKDKGDEEITNAEKVETEHKEINQEFNKKFQKQSSSLLTIPVSVIPEPIILSSIPEIVTAAPHKVSDMEKEVKELKQVNLTTTIRTSIRSKVPLVVNEYLGSSLGYALQKELQKHTKELRQECS